MRSHGMALHDAPTTTSKHTPHSSSRLQPFAVQLLDNPDSKGSDIMPQGSKVKAKARLPPKTQPRVKNTKLNATRKAAPMKSKIVLSRSQKVFKAGEKEIRNKIEKEMRSRAITDGSMPSTSAVKGSELHSQTTGITAKSVKMIMRKLK